MMNNDRSMRKKSRGSVASLCRIIAERIHNKPQAPLSEYSLRKELVACILGSQVRYEMAFSTLERIETAGLLDDMWWDEVEDDSFEDEIFWQLSKGYRFPKVRAKQIVGARNSLTGVSLTLLLKKTASPQHMRKCLAGDIPGLGPKQASMFLRNIGWSYELAILDVHVLRFMELQAIITKENARISNLRTYESIEKIAINFANDLGYPVGYLDMAIWATMKAASELRM